MEKGDYALATKWHDGDPGDQWCVGFYDREKDGRHWVVGNSREQFRANGFRRVAKISGKRGEFLIRNISEIEMGVRSLWWWKRCQMSI